jgi:hypothetical protein
MSHSSLNHTHRSLTVIWTEPWHRAFKSPAVFNCDVNISKQFAIPKIFTRTPMPRLRPNDREWAVGMVENQTFARPGVLRAVSSTVIIRFWRWIRRKCLSSRCDVTRDLPLHGLSFVLSVCRKRIISLDIVRAMRPVVRPIRKQRHRTARWAWARVRRCWRPHSW